MKNVTEKEFYQDEEGIKYKHPERTCKDCLKYPCFRGQENFESDMAKYGCIHYIESIPVVRKNRKKSGN